MFFLIYINDLNKALESEPRLFADNTRFLVKGSSVEYLELIINYKLNFHKQIKATEGKVARSVGILNKLKQTLSLTVIPYNIISYICRATYPTYLQKLKLLQNRAIRSVVGAHF